MSAPIDKQKRPKVGVGVIVLSKHHPNCVLIGKRKGQSPGEGHYALPGGHLEFGESWETCAYRETLEETGLRLTDLQYCAVVNAVEVDKDYHYVTLFVKGEVDYSNGYQQEPRNLEPDKCEGWQWQSWDLFPPATELFCPLRVLIEEGYQPFQNTACK